LEEELFPETVEILLESDSKEDMNAMISSLQIGGTDIPHVSDETYEDLRRARAAQYNRTKYDNMRKRANGEHVDTHGNLKLEETERASDGTRACKTPNCRNLIVHHLKDGTGQGYCQTHAPKSFFESKICTYSPRMREVFMRDSMESAKHTLTAIMRDTKCDKRE
jgi:hypothetical protein